MATKKSKQRRFKGLVSRNATKQRRGLRSAHLSLPKGMSLFREEAKTRVSLDILPYEVREDIHPDRDDEYEIATPGSLWYKRPYWLHRNIGPNNETVICLATVKQRCPICDHRTQMLQEGAEWNDDAIRALKSSMRNLYAVIPRGHKEYEEKIHIWDVSQFLFQDKLNEEIQENEEYDAFPDLEEGFTLQIRFSENQVATNRFAETSRIDFKSRHALPESLLAQIPSLDTMLEIPSKRAVEAVFLQGIGVGEVEEEEAKPARTITRKPSRLRFASAEDEDDEEEVVVEEEGGGEGDDEEEESEDDDDGNAAALLARKAAPAQAQAPAPSRKPPQPAQQQQEAAAPLCPRGYVFGNDCDAHEECAACSEWEECIDASNA